MLPRRVPCVGTTLCLEQVGRERRKKGEKEDEEGEGEGGRL